MPAREKIAADLAQNGFLLDLSDSDAARRYGLDVEELNIIIDEIIANSTLVASDPDDNNWDCDTIYYYNDSHFLVSGGGMSSVTISFCSDVERRGLMKKWMITPV